MNELVEDKEIKNKFDYKSKLKFLKSLIIILIITSYIKACGTYLSTMEKVWQEHEIPYDIKWKYANVRTLIFVKIILESKGFNKDSLLISTLTKIHKYLYEAMLTQIPEDDMIRLSLHYSYELMPILYRNNYDELLDNMPKFLNILEQLKTGKSLSNFINNIYKFQIAQIIINTISNIDLSKLENTAQANDFKMIYVPKLVELSWYFSNELKPHYHKFLFYQGYNLIPINLLFYSINMYSKYLGLEIYGITCDAKQVKEFLILVNELQFVIELFQGKIRKYEQADFLKVEAVSNDLFKAVDKLYNDYCKN